MAAKYNVVWTNEAKVQVDLILPNFKLSEIKLELLRNKRFFRPSFSF